LIDLLALRAGNEKTEKEADTVGCCSLKARAPHPTPHYPPCPHHCCRASLDTSRRSHVHARGASAAQVENVGLPEPGLVRLNFLGKDSILYDRVNKACLIASRRVSGVNNTRHIRCHHDEYLPSTYRLVGTAQNRRLRCAPSLASSFPGATLMW